MLMIFTLIGLLASTLFLAKTCKKLGIENRSLKEQITNRSQRISEFAHEIKHPISVIASILSASVVLTKGVLKDSDQENLEQATLEAHSLSDLLQDYLSLCLCETGKLRARPKSVNLYLTVRAIKNIFKTQLRAQGSKLVFSEVDRELEVFVDPQHLKQILFNLVHNSLRHAGDNITIEIRSNGINQSGMLEIEYLDDGCGFLNFEDIFDQNGTIQENNKASLGLGLQLCNSLIMFSGGEISFANAEYGGVVISFVLPEARGVPEIEKFDTSKRVMLVTDGDSKSAGLAQQLEGLGASVDAISDVISALQALTENDFEAVIIDEHVDHDCGIELAKLINEDLDLQNTKKFIFLSSDNQPSEICSLEDSQIWPAQKGVIKELLS